MKLEQLTEALQPFKDKTGLPTYDDMMKDPDYFERAKGKVFRIIKMSPEEYLKRASKGFEISVSDLKNSREQKLANKYANDMMKGDKFPMIVLDYSRGSFGQEGVHRAMAAEKLNIKNIPVMVVTDK